MSAVAKYRVGQMGAEKSAAIAAELKRIEETAAQLTPESVLAEAKKKSSVLHSFFEWNDDEAAHRYRLQQASWLIRHVSVEIAGDEGAVVTRQFVNVTVAEDGDTETPPDSRYVSVQTALSDEAMRAEVLDVALCEFRRLRQKYAALKELAGIFSAIDASG